MRYNALAALWYNALSRSCILSFSVSSNQAHCLCLSARQAEDSAPGAEWLLAWFLLIYLLVTYLNAILHTCLSNTSCSPRRATMHCLHTIRICVCKKRIRRILFTSLRTCKHRSWLWIWGRQGPRPVCSRWEEVLYLARLKHWFHSENNVHVKDLGHAKN